VPCAPLAARLARPLPPASRACASLLARVSAPRRAALCCHVCAPPCDPLWLFVADRCARACAGLQPVLPEAARSGPSPSDPQRHHRRHRRHALRRQPLGRLLFERAAAPRPDRPRPHRRLRHDAPRRDCRPRRPSCQLGQQQRALLWPRRPVRCQQRHAQPKPVRRRRGRSARDGRARSARRLLEYGRVLFRRVRVRASGPKPLPHLQATPAQEREPLLGCRHALQLAT
jgi:hypothetical protein